LLSDRYAITLPRRQPRSPPPARGIEPPPQHLPFQELAAVGMVGPSSDLSCPTSSPSEQIARTHRRSQSKGTGMKIVVIGLTGLIGSKLVATITQVSHA
jgi:hypothetical protein